MSTSMFLAGVPLLPAPELVPWASSISWALVLGAAVLWLGRGMKGRLPWLAALGVAAWTLVPGPVSPAYWLALAFQSPSTMSVVLCLAWVLSGWRRSWSATLTPAATAPVWRVLWGGGVLLGWVLLLDMLALWPVSMYAWGFSPAALALVCGLAGLVWLVGGARQGGWQASVVLATVLLLFAVTRLPSGNVWDALLDPWLWTGLQLAGLRRFWRWRRGRG